MADEDDDKGAPEIKDQDLTFGDELPVLPIRNAVLFPGAVAPFDVGREKSVALVEDIDSLTTPVIAIFAQRDPSTDDPVQGDLYPVGVAARVLKALKHSSGNYSLILQGLMRVRMEGVTGNAPYLKARVSRLDEPKAVERRLEAAKKEKLRAGDFDLVLVNETVEETARRLAASVGVDLR